MLIAGCPGIGALHLGRGQAPFRVPDPESVDSANESMIYQLGSALSTNLPDTPAASAEGAIHT